MPFLLLKASRVGFGVPRLEAGALDATDSELSWLICCGRCTFDVPAKLLGRANTKEPVMGSALSPPSTGKKSVSHTMRGFRRYTCRWDGYQALEKWTCSICCGLSRVKFCINICKAEARPCPSSGSVHSQDRGDSSQMKMRHALRP